MTGRGVLGRDELVDLSCDVPLEAADDLAACLALGEASPQVVLGAAVPAQAAEHNVNHPGVFGDSTS